MRKLQEEKDILDSLEAERSERILEFGTKSKNGTIVGKLKEYNAYISVMNEKIMKQKENVNYAEKNVDKVREELIKVVQEREILEKLKEKKLNEYKEQLGRDEQKLNDEIVSFNRSSTSTGDKNG